MRQANEVLLQILGKYLSGVPISSLSPEQAKAALTLSIPHNILPIVYSALKSYGDFEDILSSYKSSVIGSTVLQARKTQRFCEFYRFLNSQNVRAVLVKGLMLRELYPEPDLRPSSDEDIILSETDFPVCFAAAQKLGFTLRHSSTREVSFYDTQTGLIIEAQTDFFMGEGALFEIMNGLFDKAAERKVTVNTREIEAETLCPTDNLLYLFCHAYKHFISSGFGIRQICDILVFTRKHRTEIDFEYVFSALGQISAQGFAADIFQIGERYLGFTDCFSDYDFHRYTVDCDTLLQDILDAGVYGKSSNARLHTAGITLAAATQGKSLESGILGRLFPKKKELEKDFPRLAERKILYPYYCAKRILGYVKNSGGKEAKQTARIAAERLRLLESYGIVESHEKERTFDDLTVDAIKKRLADGKTATLQVTGSSMVPFLVSGRDSVVLSAINGPVKAGDVVLYQRKNGAYILHRVIKSNCDGLFFAGDAQTYIEGPIEKSQLIGVCTGFIRKGVSVTGKEKRWRAYDKIWRKVRRLRPFLLRAYGKSGIGKN